MSLHLTIRNRQRNRAIDVRLLRKIATSLFDELPQAESIELGVFLVGSPEMTRWNETFLRHEGSTDVITFDYSDYAPRGASRGLRLQGEILLCVDEAVLQARRFRTTWTSELTRYLIHGVLHLLGYDDRRKMNRRRMKREEDRLVRRVAARFPLSQLACKPRIGP